MHIQRISFAFMFAQPGAAWTWGTGGAHLAQVSQKQAVLDLGDDYPHGLGPGVRGQHLAPQLLDGVRGGLLGVVHGKRKPAGGGRALRQVRREGGGGLQMSDCPN